MPAPTFLSNPAAVTPDCLHNRRVLESAVGITHLRWEAIGTGQVGDSVRFHLTYSRSGADPATLAAKFPAADEHSRSTAAMMGLYSKEIQFYRNAAPHPSVRVPKSPRKLRRCTRTLNRSFANATPL